MLLPAITGYDLLRWSDPVNKYRKLYEGKAIPVQAVGVHRVVRRRGSHMF
jgi:hypothetical protein